MAPTPFPESAFKTSPTLHLQTEAGEIELQVLYEQRWKVSNRRTNLVRIQGIILDLMKAGDQDHNISTMQPVLDRAFKAYACILGEARKEAVVEMYEMANPEEGFEKLAEQDADRINEDIALAADPDNWLDVFRADMDHTLSQWKPRISWAEMKHARDQRRKDEHVKRVVDRQFRETVGAFLNPRSHRWGLQGDEVPEDVLEVSRDIRERQSGGKSKVCFQRELEKSVVMEPSEDEAHSPQSIDRVARHGSRRERAKSIERAIKDSGLTIEVKEERERARDRAAERYRSGERRKSQQLSPELQQGEHPHPLRGNPPSQTWLPLHQSPQTPPSGRPLPQTPQQQSPQQQAPSPPQPPPHRQLPRKPVRKGSAFKEDLP